MKKLIAYILMFCILLNPSFVKYKDVPRNKAYEKKQEVKAADVLTLQSRSACLMEPITGKILFEKNADEQLRPASVTKIMTLLLIFDEIKKDTIHYDDIVTVSEHAASMGGSQCFFEAGEQQKVVDMIKCIEIASGNDAAVAMAEHIAGSEEAFVNMMNEKAKELGMENTHFENACGLEAEGHLTTARDIAIMSRELITKHKEIFDYSTTWMDSIYHTTKRGTSQFDLANTNKFLNQYTGATGLKTGYTSQAKYCMSATAKRNDIELIAVIMGADTKDIRNSEACKLLDYGFSRCKTYVDENPLDQDYKAVINGGVKDEIGCKLHDIKPMILIDSTPESIEKQIVIDEDLRAPIEAETQIGTIVYKVNGETLNEVPIYAAESVAKRTYKHCTKTLLKQLFMMTTGGI